MYLKWPTLVKCGFLHAKMDNPDILNIPNHLYGIVYGIVLSVWYHL